MKICPNLNNPDVAREFNELIDAIGEKAAYLVWSLNNGNSIDKAPNGEPSILFLNLEKGSSRIDAIRSKSKVFTNSYIEKTRWNESTLILTDANGEPDPHVDLYRDHLDVSLLERAVTHDILMRGNSKSDMYSVTDEYLQNYGVYVKSQSFRNGLWHIKFDVTSESGVKDTIGKERISTPSMPKRHNVVLSQAKMVVNNLNSVFGNKFNIHWLTNEEWENNESIDTNADALIIGSDVYLRSERISTQVAAEEMLHTLVFNLKYTNKELFDNLLNLAKHDFPKLWGEIDKLYKNNKDEELVTQVLSRYYTHDDRFEKLLSRSLRDLIKQFIGFIGNILKKIPSFDYFSRKFNLDVNDFAANMSYDDLVDILTVNDVNIPLYTLEHLMYSLNASNSFVLNVYDQIDDINSQRESFIQQQLAQYKSNMGTDMSASQVNRLHSTYNENQLVTLVRKVLDLFAIQYGLTRTPNGYYQAKTSNPADLLITHIVNSMDENTFEAYRKHDPSTYKAVAGIRNKSAILNTIAAVIRGDAGINLQTLDEELTRDYIRAFWNSNLILSALDVLNDTGKKTSEQLETELVTAVTKEDWRDTSRSQKLQDIIKNFWQSLTNLVQSVFGRPKWATQQKLDILNAVQAAVLYKDDLDISQGMLPIYDRMDGNFLSSLFLTEQDKSILNRIKQGTEVRLKAALAKKLRNQLLVDRLRTELEILGLKDKESIDDIFATLDDFVRNADKEILRTAKFINDQLLKPIDTWDAEQLSAISTDLIGYYSGLLSNLHQWLRDKDNAVHTFNEYRVLNDPNALNLETYSQLLISDISKLRESYMNNIAKPMALNFIDTYVDNNDTISDKTEFKRKARIFLDLDTTFGDLQAGEVLIGLASRSKSPLVRIVQNIIKGCDDERGRIVLKKGTELMRAYRKISFGKQISPFNFLKLFMEFDRDGVPTGYFIRDINEGQFLIDKDNYEQKLRDGMNKNLPDDKKLTIDEEGNTVFPDEVDETADNSIYNLYMDKLDEWLDQHCERRYKLEYYKKRRRYLHRSTIIALLQIQRQISTLTKKAEVTPGVYDLWNKLTAQERKQLDNLRKAKRDLSSHYIFRVEQDGLHLEEKTGDALRMADEITAWLKYLSRHIKYSPDWSKYNELLSRITDPAERKAFEKANTKIIIKPEFFDLLSRAGKHFEDEELSKLQKRHSEIIAQLKISDGYQPYDLRKLGTGLNGNTEVWAEIKRLELAMVTRRKELLNQGKFTQGNSSINFNDIAVMWNAMSFDKPNRSDIEYLLSKWANAWATNTNLRLVFIDLFTYTDEKGQVRYLNVFLQLGPKELSMIETVPVSIYSSIDDSSDFKNDAFDENNGKSLQAKRSIYENKDFAKLKTDKDIFAFYNMLRQTMAEANANIPQRGLYREDLLPQITGRTLSTVMHSPTVKEMFKNVGYSPWATNMTAEYANNAGDVDMVTDIPRRPDGSLVQNVPIRFTNRLKNRALLTNDVIGSILTYYDMAINYALKSNALPLVDNIVRLADPSTQVDKSHALPQLYSKLQNLLDYGFYGKETTIGNVKQSKKRLAGKADAKRDAGWIQKGKSIRRIVSIAMLGVNFTTIEIGYLDAMATMLTDSIGGKYLTKKDFVYGLAASAKHTFSCLANLGKLTTNDWLIAAMLYNQLSKSNSEIFGKSDLSKWSRLFGEYLLMGGYTLTDYMVNGAMLESTYHHFRLMKDPITGKNKFMSKSMAMKAYANAGYTEKDANKLWSKAKTTLADAYEVKDGYFTVRDKYKDVVTKLLENLIQNRLKDRTAVYNGVIPQSEKAKLQLNVWGSYISLMRNFLINTYWERFNTGVDYMSDEKGAPSWTSEYKRDDMGFEDLDTGEFTGAMFKDFCRGMAKVFKMAGTLFSSKPREKLTENLSYAVKRCLAELTMIAGAAAIMLYSVASMRSMDPPDDEKVWTINIVDVDGEDRPVIDVNWDAVNMRNFARFLMVKTALLSTRFFNERITPWSPWTAMDLIKSPTVATSWFDNVGYALTMLQDVFKGRLGEEVTRAGYQHMSRGTRDILTAASFLGLNTLVKLWHESGLRSTLNYYLGVTPINFIVPSASDWEKSHQSDDLGETLGEDLDGEDLGENLGGEDLGE